MITYKENKLEDQLEFLKEVEPVADCFTSINFKFKIGQEVYYKLRKKNGIVTYQCFIHDVDATRITYGLSFEGDSGSLECNEKWIEEGHRIE